MKSEYQLDAASTTEGWTHPPFATCAQEAGSISFESVGTSVLINDLENALRSIALQFVHIFHFRIAYHIRIFAMVHVAARKTLLAAWRRNGTHRARNHMAGGSHTCTSVRSSNLAKTLVFFCILSILSPGVCAHGLLMRPPARSIFAVDPVDTCPQCLSAGGVGVLEQHDGLHGLAGDPWDQAVPRDHEAGGRYYRGVYATQIQASILDIEVLTTTNHYGRFEFRICKVSGGYETAAEREAEELTEACLNENQLVQAHTPSAQEVGARYFYATPGDPEVYRYSMQYQLPEELVCDGVESHCVLQFQWQTLHGCKPEGWPEEYALDKAYGDCGDPEDPDIFSEWFYNVADLVIVPPGNGSVDTEVLSNGQRMSKTYDHPSLLTYYQLE